MSGSGTCAYVRTTKMKRGLGLLERPIFETRSCIRALNVTFSAAKLLNNYTVFEAQSTDLQCRKQTAILHPTRFYH